MDCLPYRRTNRGITFISVDLAHYEIFRAKFVVSGKSGINNCWRLTEIAKVLYLLQDY